MNRKLIRPSFDDIKRESDGANGGANPYQQPHRANTAAPVSPRPHTNEPEKNATFSKNNKRPPQPETNAEVFYYKKQIDSRTEMVVVLHDGEQIEGTIEWYDLDALKINRTNAPNVLLFKHNIKYMFKAQDRAEIGAADE